MRCLSSLNLNRYKNYDSKCKNARLPDVCFCTKSPKNRNGNNCVLCHNFCTNQNLDQLSISKWLSELQFCERCTYISQKMARNGHKTVICKGTFVSNQSLTIELLTKDYWIKPDFHILKKANMKKVLIFLFRFLMYQLGDLVQINGWVKTMYKNSEKCMIATQWFRISKMVWISVFI